MDFLIKFLFVMNVFSAILNFGFYFVTGAGGGVYNLLTGILNAGVAAYLTYVIAQDD